MEIVVENLLKQMGPIDGNIADGIVIYVKVSLNITWLICIVPIALMIFAFNVMMNSQKR